MNSPSISVIVPFFNIRDCVDYCVTSLLAQEYKDFELLLVDDGSTDGTGELLDKYLSDSRVRVIHKRNGGLSDARNRGVLESQGKYISFVDGDDFVSPFYLSSLVEAMGDSSNRIVMGHFITKPYSEKGDFGKISWSRPSLRVLSKFQAIKSIMYDRIQPSAWAKLASRDIYEKVKFPTGARYEEIRTIIKFTNCAQEYVELIEPIYGYVMRSGSITWSKEASIDQIIQYKFAIDTICEDALESKAVDSKAISYQRALLNVRLHSQLPEDARKSREIRTLDNESISEVRRLLFQGVLNNNNVELKNKLRFALLAICRPLYDYLYKIYKKHNKGVSGK